MWLYLPKALLSCAILQVPHFQFPTWPLLIDVDLELGRSFVSYTTSSVIPFVVLFFAHHLMADLTILSSAPTYPLSNDSQSGVYTTFTPGASSSRFSLGLSLTDLPTTLGREGSDDTASASEPSEDGDGHETDDTSSLSSVDDMQVKPMANDSSRGRAKMTESRSGGFGKRERLIAVDSEKTPTATTIPHSPPPSSPALESHITLLPPTQRGRQQYQRHRPTRSRSAPPSSKPEYAQDGETTPTASYTPASSASASQMSFEQYSTYETHRPLRRSRTTFTYNSGLSTPSSIFVSTPPWARDYGVTMGGELLKPPPPLHRPTTFWRRTPRSGVTSSSYSPSSHVIRRSTFVAAGLPFERPMADLSALCVESRMRSSLEEKRTAKLNDVFWEVIVER
ncbi:hypothetical protein E1B28_003043 [Marasmius oreades]|uniref:Uncharacterized protein n=1 Tax=Marasmius oreades TaxID=181124 RepID=A0A9P7RLQ8_9AGAR|nr:uncharacterized protein E1B28_003043 [Marasmius oreades]KAG7085480.1 hypothetical protein E1B28_003043 [Marasmius oreades]